MLPAPLRLTSARPPSTRSGIAVAGVAIALITALIYALKEVAPVASTGVVYLLAVLAVSSLWGIRLGLVTALASALAWNFFHIPPVHRLAISDAENWVALAIFVAAAAFSSALAAVARSRTVEAERRRRESDLLRELASTLLAARGVEDAQALMAERLSRALDLSSATVELRTVGGDLRRVEIPLRAYGEPVGTLLVPRDSAPDALETLERLSSSLAVLLATARSRERLERQLVGNEALRRSDALKTALLRAVSHDLRSPLTAINTAAEGMALAHDTEAIRELASVIALESRRLSGLVDDLLDLSRLETGSAAPRMDWCSIDEVVAAALDSIGAGDEVRLALDADLPLVRADSAQLERALANVLDNARRHAAGAPVTVQARRVQHRLRIRVTDQGPGIAPEALERIFEPFVREEGGAVRAGSGLGLAIARGFVEVNGGRMWAESLPGQGTTFAIELPLRAAPATPRAPEGAAPA